MNADALSRLPFVQCGQTDDDNRLESVHTIDDCYLFGKKVEELHDLQSGDPSIGPVLQAKRLGAKPKLEENKQSSLKGRRLLQLWDQLHFRNEMLYRVFESTDGRSRHQQWVVLTAVRDDIIRDLMRGTPRRGKGDELTPPVLLLARALERYSARVLYSRVTKLVVCSTLQCRHNNSTFMISEVKKN